MDDARRPKQNLSVGIGKRIEGAMIAAGKNAADIARLFGITDSAVSQWFTKDTGPRSDRLPKLAEFLGVDVRTLLQEDTSKLPRQAMNKEPTPTGEADIPVWASAAAGREGAIVLVPDPIDYMSRSEKMRSVRNPYAFEILGSSMSPALEHLDRVVVNPALRPRTGVDCLFFQQQEDGTILALVKRFLRESSDSWKVRQFTPKRDFELPKPLWPKVHVIAEIRRGGLY